MSSYQSKQGRYGVHSIDHFALEIPDLAKGKHFFDNFGLRVEEKPEVRARAERKAFIRRAVANKG